MAKFADELGGKLGVRVTNIEWLQADEADPLKGLAQKLGAIRRCKLVVTDTYHCALNALREGVPAICIGTGADTPNSTLSDKKKELLYGMFNARQLYLFSERIKPLARPLGYRREAGKMLAVLDDQASLDRLFANIEAASSAAETSLREALLNGA